MIKIFGSIQDGTTRLQKTALEIVCY